MSASESSSSSPDHAAASDEKKEPKFIVESVEPSNRDGEQDRFIIVSIKPNSNQAASQQQQQQPQRYRVYRSFHDFQFLEQQLFHSGQCLYGYIIPPFPSQLTQTKEQSSMPETSNGKPLPGYGRFVSDEFQLFHWLRLVLDHPIFGHSGLVDPFLTEKNIPPPGKIVKPIGIFKSIQDTFDSRKFAHKDCDLFFQNERDWSIKVHELMQLSTDAFNSTINARHSLSQVLAHLSAALSVPIGGDNTGLNKVALQTNLAFSRALDGYREYVEAETINGASTLGATLLLWTRFVESEKEMLKQRTCLLVEYESANRNYDKARGQRRPEIEEAKSNAERTFEKCSDTARAEIKRFQATRVRDLSRSLNEYRNSQLDLAKEHYEKLSQLYQQVADELRTVAVVPTVDT